MICVNFEKNNVLDVVFLLVVVCLFFQKLLDLRGLLLSVVLEVEKWGRAEGVFLCKKGDAAGLAATHSGCR